MRNTEKKSNILNDHHYETVISYYTNLTIIIIINLNLYTEFTFCRIQLSLHESKCFSVFRLVSLSFLFILVCNEEFPQGRLKQQLIDDIEWDLLSIWLRKLLELVIILQDLQHQIFF